MFNLDGKVALITGAAKGIGLATAKAFARAGAQCILSDVNDKLGKAALQEIASPPGREAIYLPLDVTQEDQWKKTIEAIETAYGPLEVLVNNAGVMGLDFGPQDPEHTSLESWQKVHQINLDSVFLGCKYGILSMKKGKGGSIINMSSRSGIVGVPTAAPYASSKAAIRNYTKSVALYCAQNKYPIRCNSMHPAAILTPLWDEVLGDGEGRQEKLKSLAAGVPLGRMGTPEDVASGALYLASDASAFVTGTELHIDGGILAGSASAPGRDADKK